MTAAAAAADADIDDSIKRKPFAFRFKMVGGDVGVVGCDPRRSLHFQLWRMAEFSLHLLMCFCELWELISRQTPIAPNLKIV